MEIVKLNNGVEMPILGYGVYHQRKSLFFSHYDPEMVQWLIGL